MLQFRRSSKTVRGVFGVLGAGVAATIAWITWGFLDPGDHFGNASTAPGLDGLYCTGSEIGGFSGTVLELRDGKFRYWFYSDVAGPDEPHYPVIGKYSVDGEKVVLAGTLVGQSIWYPDTVNGIRVLWRDDGLRVWRDQRKIYDYAVLIKTDARVSDDGIVQGPSIRSLYDGPRRRRVRVWKDAFVHGPQ